MKLRAPLFLLIFAGCTSSNVPTASSVRYFKDVKPIVDAKCVGCHAEGKFAPFSLQAPADVVARRVPMKIATQARTMPPWPPSNECTQYQGDRSLSEEQLAVLAAWGDSEGLLGEPADFKALTLPPGPELSRTDLTIPMPEAFTPSISPDEYRCFLLDWPLTEDTHITGFSVSPGAVALVHHALVYAVSPADVAAYQQLDAAEPGQGYSCFAGPNKGLPNIPAQIGGWVPGTFGIDYPAGTGIKVNAGSKLVVQMHYNTGHSAPEPDLTQVRLKLDSTVMKEAFIMPFTNPAWARQQMMPIAAGDPDAVHQFSFDAVTAVALRTQGAIDTDKAFTVYTAALHQHLHGTHTNLEIVHADGGSQCLLDIPDWDFHWQGSYAFVQPKKVVPGDAFHITCHWDNSEARQPPGPDGRPLTPRDINWGEGTTDEMCVGFMYLTQ